MIKKYQTSDNLFDFSTSETGYGINFTTGALVEDAEAVMSDYISVSEGVYESNSNVIVIGYDENKTYQGTYYSTSGTWRKQFNATKKFSISDGDTITYVKLLTSYGMPPLSQTTSLVACAFKEWFYRKYESATDNITTLPADVIADGQSASADIIGNMVQTGTPSPQSIIMPDECGDKTANLFDVSTVEKGRIDNGVVGYTSQTTALSIVGDTVYFTTKAIYRGVCSGFIEIPSTGSITFNFTKNSTLGVKFCFYDSDKTWLNADVTPQLADIPPATVSIPTGAKYVRLSFTGQATGGSDYVMSNIILNTGSTSPSNYIPYGYKIPILSGGTTTNVYLGEVQSTRQIKKVVFDGTEDWSNAGSGSSRYYRLAIESQNSIIEHEVICSHFEQTEITSSTTDFGCDAFTSDSASSDFISFRMSGISSATDFKIYLQQQYANGTPVTVWYVLATPATGILNEPIRKIGTYADSVSVTGIPTTGTAESFDVDTTLKPSEVSLTYHGWHEHQDTKYTT